MVRPILESGCSYSTVIRLARGDSYVMANYLPVCLDPAIRIWLTSLLEASITSWGDLKGSS
ncbi:hypothetical protein PR202_gb27312 [Eleusine coracana subsp. coracana]|uniref:Uncharacterized protein n=1 Tax=Eleusine coracana subsp. coracana TaxID=191504 RepID=A0AAV5FTX3_ELECO|nr:hypothetical protein PR202_gb27312 [Eleusine coracana subsp. coracana]